MSDADLFSMKMTTTGLPVPPEAGVATSSEADSTE